MINQLKFHEATKMKIASSRPFIWAETFSTESYFSYASSLFVEEPNFFVEFHWLSNFYILQKFIWVTNQIHFLNE